MDLSALYSLFQKYPAVTTDSRRCPEGSLFFALKGERFDGNDYVEQALASGVAYAIADRKNLPENERIIQVEDVLKTLQDLARYHRRQMPATVIAVTGTNGKTTTKELIAAALSAQFPTHYTQGNLNNDIGVPLTLLQLRREHAFAVIEMGANHPGEIHRLCEITEPDYGLITNVGKAHLAGFGSFEGVVRTKAELYDFLRETDGTAFVNMDHLILKELFNPLSSIYYGTNPEAFVHGKLLTSTPFLSLEWAASSVFTLQTRLVGGYNLENVLAAIAVAVHFGVESETVNRAIAAYEPTNNRSQNLQTVNNQLIIDAYNANPSSMQAALDNFEALPDSPKMVLLGEMRELGVFSREEHQKIVDRLIQGEIEKIILVGTEFTSCSTIPSDWRLFPQTEDLLNYLQTTEIKGYTILIKGSRGNQLERTTAYL
ncbi:MAG: UDP-N-acetylmuramoyl-tripeptide--D-alanyl-D-alanine ligase [Dysgonamonadaceae bacterium]|jgi:UDP-N-acetylmuramoyl-tripeptide--D-alanyl-D-alanine ligase|nr:UDP-N-acetylmuramoyl-tripeptide--D-alanyl-D-alanine ligase [Dysgonamonadaceae bacterium]